MPDADMDAFIGSVCLAWFLLVINGFGLFCDAGETRSTIYCGASHCIKIH